MIDEIRAIAIFTEVIKAGSFSRAAKRLNLSASAVSYNISQLEKRIGNALIYRSTRKLSLTQEGEFLYRYSSELLSGIASCLDEISGQSSTLHGRLVISSTTALEHSRLNSIIADFCLEHPNINFEIHYTDERQNLISDGVDLAIRAGDMPASSLKSTLIMHVERKLVCSKPYYYSKNRPCHPKEIANWCWIKLTMMPEARVFRKGKKKFITSESSGNLSVNSIDAMVEFCSQDMGLATPPAFLVEKQLKQGSLIEVLPDWKVDAIPVYAVWPQNQVKNKNTSKFLDFLKEFV